MERVVCVIIWKTWKWVEGRSYRIRNSPSGDENFQYNTGQQYISTKTVVIVDTSKEWDAAYSQLKEDLKIKKVLGMDCEWVNKGKVALLQLCSANGFCVLVRLFKLKAPYPKTLTSLLEDRSILKTGVAVVDDGHKLHHDYGLLVSGCVDLRHVLLRLKLHSRSMGLKGLAYKVLHLDISKNPAIRCSNWEADTYSQQQVNYAATDAAVGVDIFVQLVLYKMLDSGKSFKLSPSSSSSMGKHSQPIGTNDEEKTQNVIAGGSRESDETFPSASADDHRDGSPVSSLRACDQEHTWDGAEQSLQEGDETSSGPGGNSRCELNVKREEESMAEDAQLWKMACSLCQGLVDVGYTYKGKSGQPSKVNKMPSKKNQTSPYSTRQRPLWDNCRLEAPDGSMLCTCDTRKAQWYMDKGLGDKVSDDPITVRLRFEPSSRPQNERNYYLQEKENQCVVCGCEKDYVRKFVVPFEYKKFFPSALKDHCSHDVLLLCVNCHRRSCEFDSNMRLRLAEECDAPVESGAAAKTVLDHDLQKVRSAGRALKLNRSSIPENRIKELEQTLVTYFGTDAVSDDLIEQAAEIDARHTADGYVPHGKKVVRHMGRNGGLLAFQTRWRQHFLDTMNPQFLPNYWSVDYVPEGYTGMQAPSE